MDNTELTRRLRDPLCLDTNDTFFMAEAATVLEAADKRIAGCEDVIREHQDALNALRPLFHARGERIAELGGNVNDLYGQVKHLTGLLSEARAALLWSLRGADEDDIPLWTNYATHKPAITAARAGEEK